jgi:CRP-like cAMP-binding protein
VISSARDPRDVHANGSHDGSQDGDHDGDGSDHDGDGKDANGASPSVDHGSVEHGADWLAACPQRQYFKGEIIPLSSVSIWQVQQGLVKLTTMSESGEEIVIGLVAPGAVFSPHMASLATYQAIALSDASLVQYTIDDLSANVWVNHVLPKLIYRLQQTEALLAVLGRQRVEERLVQMLLLLQKEVGEPQPDGSTRLMVRLTHEDMADICRTSRSTVTRMLGKLQRQGKLRSDEANHLILLPALAGGEKRHQTGSKVSLG